MKPQYFLFKRVAENIWYTPSSILRLQEFEGTLSGIAQVKWGINPRGPIDVKNPDGTVASLPAMHGFVFLASGKCTDPLPFYICYECYGGVAIHSENDQRVEDLLMEVAPKLKAKVFRIP